MTRSATVQPTLHAAMAILALAVTATLAPAETLDAPGGTRIATWHDDRTAAFLLMFDDGWPSQFQVAGPALHERGMVATFYLNPGKAEFSQFPKQWEEMRRLGMVFANHTMTHRGAPTPEAGVKEIEDCQAALMKLVPGKEPRLISFGMPGVDKWTLYGDALLETLKRNHLIDRPPFTDHGAVYHMQTTAQMLALADKAIAAKGMEYLVIHGLERIVPDWKYQDFWALKQDVFLPLLDGLKERRDRGDLWITDHITWHQYQAERAASTVKVIESTSTRISLELTATTDPSLYDTPLTLVTTVPRSWTRVAIAHGAATVTATTTNGQVRYDAVPDSGVITLSAAP